MSTSSRAPHGTLFEDQLAALWIRVVAGLWPRHSMAGIPGPAPRRGLLLHINHSHALLISAQCECFFSSGKLLFSINFGGQISSWKPHWFFSTVFFFLSFFLSFFFSKKTTNFFLRETFPAKTFCRFFGAIYLNVFLWATENPILSFGCFS